MRRIFDATVPVAMTEANNDKDRDRRLVQRTRISRNAKIIAPHRTSVIHCTVQDITSGGACLKVANSYGMPHEFELTFEHGRTRRACRVVWWTEDTIGVAFESSGPAAG